MPLCSSQKRVRDEEMDEYYEPLAGDENAYTPGEYTDNEAEEVSTSQLTAVDIQSVNCFVLLTLLCYSSSLLRSGT